MEFQFIYNTDIRYSWGFILQKMLKYGTTRVLLGSYIVKNAAFSIN